MALELKLTNDQLTDALHAAVLTALGEDAKATLVSHAVKYLTTPPPASGYHRQEESPLLQALNIAAHRTAVELINERLKSDPTLMNAINEAITAAVQRFTEERKEKLASKFADAISDAFTGSKY